MSDITQQEPNFGESASYDWENGRVYRLKNSDSVLARNPDGSNAFSNLATQALVNRTRNLHLRTAAIEANGWVTEPRLADGAVTRRKAMADARAIGATLTLNAPFNAFLPKDTATETDIYGNPFNLGVGGQIAPFVKLYRDLSNRVFLEGFFCITGSGSPTGLLCTLPAQFRPKDVCVFSIASLNGIIATVSIRINGQMKVAHYAAGSWTSDPKPFPLNSICFMADDATSEFQSGPPS